jgi:hypothetical protein
LLRTALKALCAFQNIEYELNLKFFNCLQGYCFAIGRELPFSCPAGIMNDQRPLSSYAKQNKEFVSNIVRVYTEVFRFLVYFIIQ